MCRRIGFKFPQDLTLLTGSVAGLLTVMVRDRAKPAWPDGRCACVLIRAVQGPEPDCGSLIFGKLLNLTKGLPHLDNGMIAVVKIKCDHV